jgi:Na+/proline symporter
MYLQNLDYAVVVVYAVILLVLAQWVSRDKSGHQKDTSDYFLAGGPRREYYHGHRPGLGMVGLGLFAVSYSLYEGLNAVALTDIDQVVLLVLGGLLIAFISLNEVSEGAGELAGFEILLELVPEKFDMIFDKKTRYSFWAVSWTQPKGKALRQCAAGDVIFQFCKPLSNRVSWKHRHHPLRMLPTGKAK